MTKSRNLIRKRWTPDAAAVELMRRRYSTTKNADLAQALGVAYHQIVKLAQKLGLKKDEAWLNGPGGRTDGRKGLGTRFQKGQSTWNKGKKLGSDWCKATQFKPGQKPGNYKPVGSFRIQSTGYLQIKLYETGYPPHDWVMYHRHIWEQVHGPVPHGCCVVFKDGKRRTDPAQITPDLLECISKSELMLRNTFHNYGPEISQLVQLRGALTRQIRLKEKA